MQLLDTVAERERLQKYLKENSQKDINSLSWSKPIEFYNNVDHKYDGGW